MHLIHYDFLLSNDLAVCDQIGFLVLEIIHTGMSQFHMARFQQECLYKYMMYHTLSLEMSMYVYNALAHTCTTMSLWLSLSVSQATE